MAEGLTFRAGTAADAEAIAQLHTDSWRRSYRGMYPDEFLDGDLIGNRRAEWMRRMDDPPANQIVILAERVHSLTGFVCGYGADDPEWGSLIDNLHVAGTLQRTGIGTELLRRGSAWFAEHFPDVGVYLWVIEANERARRFYEALGGRHVETTESRSQAGLMICRIAWPEPGRILEM